MIKSQTELFKLKHSYNDMRQLRDVGGGKGTTTEVLVGLATCGVAAGGKEIYAILEETIKEMNLENIKLVKVGCIGSCYCEPTVQVNAPGHLPVYYGYVDEESAKKIVEEHLSNGKIVE